jgi:hypothetical protein
VKRMHASFALLGNSNLTVGKWPAWSAQMEKSQLAQELWKEMNAKLIAKPETSSTWTRILVSHVDMASTNHPPAHSLVSHVVLAKQHWAIKQLPRMSAEMSVLMASIWQSLELASRVPWVPIDLKECTRNVLTARRERRRKVFALQRDFTATHRNALPDNFSSLRANNVNSVLEALIKMSLFKQLASFAQRITQPERLVPLMKASATPQINVLLVRIIAHGMPFVLTYPMTMMSPRSSASANLAIEEMVPIVRMPATTSVWMMAFARKTMLASWSVFVKRTSLANDVKFDSSHGLKRLPW